MTGNAITIIDAKRVEIEPMVFDADGPPQDRETWQRDTLINFKGTTRTLAEHAKRHGACIECVMYRLKNFTLRIALRDSRPKRLCARYHTEFMLEVARQYREALRAGEPALSIMDRMMPGRKSKRGKRK